MGERADGLLDIALVQQAGGDQRLNHVGDGGGCHVRRRQCVEHRGTPQRRGALIASDGAGLAASLSPMMSIVSGSRQPEMTGNPSDPSTAASRADAHLRVHQDEQGARARLDEAPEALDRVEVEPDFTCWA